MEQLEELVSWYTNEKEKLSELKDYMTITATEQLHEDSSQKRKTSSLKKHGIKVINEFQ